MGSCYAKKACEIALGEVGYQGDGKWCKYSADLDSVGYFNYPKNGAADWCSIFVNWVVWKACIDPSADEDPDGAKWTAYYMMCEPDSPSSNCAAGCGYAADYFMQKDCWSSDSSGAERGDQIFFVNSSGVYYHTGIVVAWGYFDELGAEGFKVVEGNTNGASVAVKYYKYDDYRIAGFGHVRYDGWELSSGKEEPPVKEDPKPQPTPEPDPEPTPEPTPEPIPEPEKPNGHDYRVNVETKLNVRTGPGTENDIIAQLDDGDVVTVIATDGNWGCIGKWQWVCMDYLTEIATGTEYEVDVNTALNVRTGPSTDYPIIRQLHDGDKVVVFETDGNWGRIGDDEWVCMDYLI